MTDGLVLFPKSTLASGPTAFDWWRLEASRCGINLNVAFFEDLMLRYDAGHASAYVDGMPLPGQAFAVVRGYNREISSHFENCGVPVINCWESMERSLDKILTHQALTAAGLPTPFTVMPMAPISYEDACDAIGAHEFIVKQNDGSRGVNVFRSESHAAALCIVKLRARSAGMDGRGAGCRLRAAPFGFVVPFQLFSRGKRRSICSFRRSG